MRRADRLFQIIQLLRGGRLVTARKLAEKLEVSERTIYRDIADLQASGAPIDGTASILISAWRAALASASLPQASTMRVPKFLHASIGRLAWSADLKIVPRP